MRFSPNLKKVLLIGTIILLGCDVSMLFAAQGNTSNPNDGSNDPQLQQLQSQAQQVEAQIKALQNNPRPVPNVNPTTSSLPPKNNLLPPAPYSSAPFSAGSQQQITDPPTQQALPSSPLNAPQTPGTLPDTTQTQAAIPAPAGPQPVYSASGMENNTATPGGNKNVEASPITESDINDAAFHAMVQNSLPMSPDQIQKLRSVYMASQFAAANSPVTPPRPTATSVFVDLAPGSTPPVVRLSQGFVSSLVFVDSSGAPWPIESYDIGNPSAFNIQWDKTSNTLMIQATVLYTYGNLAVKLRGLDTPVMLTLVPGQKAVDYRVDLRIEGTGPNSKSSGVVSALPPSTSTDLLNVLDGVPPPNSKVLKVEGGNCQAWLAGDKMYLRTRLSVLSPGYDATLSSADGMHAYQMQSTPMLLVSQNGQVLQLKVEGF